MRRNNGQQSAKRKSKKEPRLLTQAKKDKVLSMGKKEKPAGKSKKDQPVVKAKKQKVAGKGKERDKSIDSHPAEEVKKLTPLKEVKKNVTKSSDTLNVFLAEPEGKDLEKVVNNKGMILEDGLTAYFKELRKQIPVDEDTAPMLVKIKTIKPAGDEADIKEAGEEFYLYRFVKDDNKEAWEMVEFDAKKAKGIIFKKDEPLTDIESLPKPASKLIKELHHYMHSKHKVDSFVGLIKSIQEEKNGKNTAIQMISFKLAVLTKTLGGSFTKEDLSQRSLETDLKRSGIDENTTITMAKDAVSLKPEFLNKDKIFTSDPPHQKDGVLAAYTFILLVSAGIIKKNEVNHTVKTAPEKLRPTRYGTTSLFEANHMHYAAKTTTDRAKEIGMIRKDDVDLSTFIEAKDKQEDYRETLCREVEARSSPAKKEALSHFDEAYAIARHQATERGMVVNHLAFVTDEEYSYVTVVTKTEEKQPGKGCLLYSLWKNEKKYYIHHLAGVVEKGKDVTGWTPILQKSTGKVLAYAQFESATSQAIQGLTRFLGAGSSN